MLCNLSFQSSCKSCWYHLKEVCLGTWPWAYLQAVTSRTVGLKRIIRRDGCPTTVSVIITVRLVYIWITAIGLLPCYTALVKVRPEGLSCTRTEVDMAYPTTISAAVSCIGTCAPNVTRLIPDRIHRSITPVYHSYVFGSGGGYPITVYYLLYLVIACGTYLLGGRSTAHWWVASPCSSSIIPLIRGITCTPCRKVDSRTTEQLHTHTVAATIVYLCRYSITIYSSCCRTTITRAILKACLGCQCSLTCILIQRAICIVLYLNRYIGLRFPSLWKRATSWYITQYQYPWVARVILNIHRCSQSCSKNSWICNRRKFIVAIGVIWQGDPYRASSQGLGGLVR